MGNFKFKRMRKSMYHYDFAGGELSVDFYMKENVPGQCYMHIKAKTGVFEIKLQGYTYGYLLESARQGLVDNIHGFCLIMFNIAEGIYQDQEFADGIMSAINDYAQRRLDKAAELAASVTPEQEQADEALMRDVAEYADAEDDKTRQELRAQWKNDVKEELFRHGDTIDNQADA